MLRQAFGLRKSSILQRVTRSPQNISSLCVSQNRTLQTTTRSLYSGDKDIGSPPQSSRSLDEKLNYFNKELTATKSEVARLVESIQTNESKSDLKFARLESEMMHLNKNLTAQMNSFTETVSAKISVLTANMSASNADMKSRLDRFENRFLFRMLFAIFSVAIVAMGGTVATTLL
ncbi:hypothetical protein A1O7_07177 [Cladophialophora yegresii CBS 114405]|uniref:Uncharacterized protein n=1 Tax=Cladophialophora yegresii CBS 114405 TaxID=1182544 RepID=W9VMU2_9EURO|nr:uncharacterized protein A1O7_07177 [Cladophialophora yegresii CBS 114405]EXJ56833.1 hypothetical protein A1O7_07177 [Cladophialophora yegresii CBS 114405]